MKRLSSFVWICIGLAVMAVGFVPATRVPIVGDDFYVLFQAQGMSHGDLWQWVTLAWGWGLQAGHFNPVGQVLGGLYHFFSLPVSSSLNSSPSYYYQAGAFLLLILSALSATFFFQATRKTLDDTYPGHTFPRVFALICVITGLTLQIHPWSNDPVTTYSMAGYGATAVGFVLLAFTMQAIRTHSNSTWTYLKVGLTALFSVVYYELLVAAVAASAIIIASALFKKTRVQPVPLRRPIILIAVGVIVPAIVFVLGRLYVSLVSGDGGYTGTAVAVGIEGFKTLAFSIISSIPGGAWAYSFYRVNPMILSRSAVVGVTILTVLLLVFSMLWWRSRSAFESKKPQNLWLPLTALVVFWVLSTAAQSFTAKYIAEISAPGLVYLFYPIGMLSVTLIVATVLSFIPEPRLLPIGAILLAIAAWFGGIQQTVNWTLGDQMRASYVLNSELGAAASNSRIDEATRCMRLQKWANLPWPDYYREGILQNLELSYQQLKHEDFCTVPGIPTVSAK